MSAYYNEIDPYAAQWLRNLIAAGHIARGEVDTRSIEDVRPDDLRGFAQCHFFAGIGVWSHALRLAQWPDTRPVWTGSCPCQPFSVAGAGAGVRDERHLWPHWFWLVEQCRPPVVFGEQVEAAARHGWLDLVQSDMEGIGYAFAPVGLPAAGVGAPHIRARLWFVADAMLAGRAERRAGPGRRPFTGGGGVGGLGHAELVGAGRDTGTSAGAEGGVSVRAECDGVGSSGAARDLADADGGHPGAEREQRSGEHRQQSKDGGAVQFWRDADWLPCSDGKARPVEPGAFPLAHGAPARVGRLRAYGNAIVPQVAAEVIAAFMECRP